MEPPPRPTPSLRSTFPTSLLTSRTVVVELQRRPRRPENKLITITKVKIIILYNACECDCSIAIGTCGIAISQEVVNLARMRELHIEMEYRTGARGYILKRCQDLYFNYCIQYSFANLTRLPIWRSSIFKSRHIYRTTPSYSYLSSISVTIWSLHIRNGGATERPL